MTLPLLRRPRRRRRRRPPPSDEQQQQQESADALDVRAAEPVDQARADALIVLTRTLLTTAGESERRGGDPVEMIVHVDLDSLRSERAHARGEIADGPALAPETLRRLGCDTAIVSIIEHDGRPLSVARRTRTIPPALRRALSSRDHGCRYPGCTHRRFLHAHHIHHWAHGGPTTIDNLLQLCSYHHRLVHEGGHSVERSGNDEIRFRGPDGTIIPHYHPPRTATGPTIERRNHHRGLTIDEHTCKTRSVGQPLDYSIAVEALCARALDPG